MFVFIVPAFAMEMDAMAGSVVVASVNAGIFPAILSMRYMREALGLLRTIRIGRLLRMGLL